MYTRYTRNHSSQPLGPFNLPVAIPPRILFSFHPIETWVFHLLVWVVVVCWPVARFLIPFHHHSTIDCPNQSKDSHQLHWVNRATFGTCSTPNLAETQHHHGSLPTKYFYPRHCSMAIDFFLGSMIWPIFHSHHRVFCTPTHL